MNAAQAQKISAVYKADQLITRISKPDTIYVVNFWATWCKPCVKELPAFDSLSAIVNSTNVKVLLVNLDFLDVQNKVNEFLKTKNVATECLLLDEVNGNNYIDLISKEWSGSIPATVIWQGNKRQLIDHKVQVTQLKLALKEFKDQH